VKKKINVNSCPCGSAKALNECCLPYINGALPAPAAEALMRSRYTAYALQNEQYLLDSWHASTRPESIIIDPSAQWLRLSILNSNNDHVEFVATYRLQGRAHKLHEISQFVFEDGNWFYVDGVIKESDPEY
jgi:SEC-C motif-containing protein